MKRSNLILTGILILLSGALHAQGKFSSKSARISFFSAAPLENIEALNKNVTVLLDSKTGDLQFSLLMKGFEFKKALMQEHFNKNYVESDKFPRSAFKGVVVNNSAIDYAVNGSHNVTVKGKLTIHGITKDVETAGKIIVNEGKLQLNSTFNILLADYNISIPKLYRDNISKSIKIMVDGSLSPL